MNLPFTTKKEVVQLINKYGLSTPLVKKALTQAAKSHSKQMRDSGKPYLEEHIYSIVKELILNLSKNKYIEDLVVVALLHDTLEDDENFTEKICKDKFPSKIFNYLKPLTKKKKENIPTLPERKKYEINKRLNKYIKSAPYVVRIIKLADRFNSLQCIHIEFGSERFDRYILETEEIFLPLAKRTSKYYYEKMKKLLKRLKRLKE